MLTATDQKEGINT